MQFAYGSKTVRVNMPDRATLLAEVAQRLRSGKGFALATINLDHLVKLRRDSAFLTAYAAHDLIVADGNPVIWLARIAKRPLTLVPGSDLVIPLSQVAADTNVGVALVGTTKEALAASAAEIVRRVPNCRIVTQISPPMGFDPDSDAARALLLKVRDSGAGLCFLALGAPKQERLAARGREEVPEVGFASIGAGLDFLAGNQTRAPRWVQRIAMEWAWRMLSAPRRLVPRYALCAAILPREAAAAMKLRPLSATGPTDNN